MYLTTVGKITLEIERAFFFFFFLQEFLVVRKFMALQNSESKSLEKSLKLIEPDFFLKRPD